MNNDEQNITFGKFVANKRKSREITLRGLAADLGIAPAYMSDIEKDRRYPPDKNKLDEIAKTLSMTDEEKNKMFDLAARAKKNTVSPDLPNYIMEHDNVRIALRKAKDKNYTNEDWQKIIDLFDEEEDR